MALRGAEVLTDLAALVKVCHKSRFKDVFNGLLASCNR